MKVGKPKSKRVPVRLRHKIEKASAAKQRKQRKEAKKNPQWRSRLKKDPGIPNLFPYKAQVLAEIEESKRRKAEEVVKRKEIAKAQREGRSIDVVESAVTANEIEEDEDEIIEDDVDEDEIEDEDESMDEQDSSNPMAALLASAQARAEAYAPDDAEDGEDDEDDNDWNGIEETNPAIQTAQLERKGLPKQAISDPIKTVAKLLDHLQVASGGIQLLLDYYEIPPLVTAGSDLNSRFLVEVARKRGRLGKGGIPNLHSAALTVLSDVDDGRLVLPAKEVKKAAVIGKGEVQVVQRMAEPFRIEGLFGHHVEDEAASAQAMAVET